MTYTLVPLAPGSYDVLLDGEIIASLVRDVQPHRRSRDWHIELLTWSPGVTPPVPFLNPVHTFSSFPAALEWLGVPNTGWVN
ncbi:hypothetical protein [Methylobacterium sp. WSM2598]|uniref:hypothetical protein n=1 Tax=Methylobacterium sp. WSM2598 TaxID=398261 RepID=UPI0003606C15|nr:hypothetical protein [Methylobacterium sp. WSM2598]